jgi:hypothetical protein
MMVRFTGAGGLVQCSTYIIVDRPDVVAGGFGQNGLPACTFAYSGVRKHVRLSALSAARHSGTSRIPRLLTNKATHHYFPQSITWMNASMLH